MQPIFTMQYGEYAVTEYFRKNSNKSSSKISVFIPASQQEKGIDLMLYKFENGINKVSTLQVKMSRTYYEDKTYKLNNGNTFDATGHLWFNAYSVPDNADWNILVGVYAKFPKRNQKKRNTKSIKWETMILAFTKDEMKDFMNQAITKKGNPEKFIGFSFDNDGNIYQTRGFGGKCRCMNKYLIDNRISELMNF